MAGRDELGAVNNFIADRGVGAFPHIFDDELTLWRQFGITTQPAFAFIDAEGNAEVHIGALGEDGLGNVIETLLLP